MSASLSFYTIFFKSHTTDGLYCCFCGVGDSGLQIGTIPPSRFDAGVSQDHQCTSTVILHTVMEAKYVVYLNQIFLTSDNLITEMKDASINVR